MLQLTLAASCNVCGKLYLPIAQQAAGKLKHVCAARQYVLVTLNLGQPMSFGGTEEPAAYGTLLSIGAISPAQNKNTSKLVRPGAQQQPPAKHQEAVLTSREARWRCKPKGIEALLRPQVSEILQTKLSVPSNRFYLTVRLGGWTQVLIVAAILPDLFSL